MGLEERQFCLGPWLYRLGLICFKYCHQTGKYSAWLISLSVLDKSQTMWLPMFL
ncbi:hypothetical protein scyTo_0016935, partial [Scyliorhinus torazame]|nr:hypothetical protein [Scyliorhinus torazame]